MAVTDRDRMILGDLTTVFSPPEICTIAIGMCEGCDIAWWGQTCTDTTVRDGTDCWPTTTEGVPKPTNGPLSGWGFYSPGLYCPDGYTSACEAIEGSTSNFQHQFRMEPSETFVGCCPSGFKCDNLNGQTCIWTVRSTTLPTVSCAVDGASDDFGFTTLPNSEANELSLYAPMIQIAWQSTDLEGLSTTTTSGLTSSTTWVSTGSGSVIDPNANANSSTEPDPTILANQPLSVGAIAGIAIGSAAIFLLILAAAIFIWRRKRSNKSAGGNGSPEKFSDTMSNPSSYTAVGSVSPDGKQFQHYYASNVVEIGQGSERVEAPGEGMGPAEVPGGHGRAEMFAGEGYPRQDQTPVGFQGQEGVYYLGPPDGGFYDPQGPAEMPAQRYS